jgi:hypothetical protein
MMNFRTLIALFAVLILTNCSTVSVNYNYDPEANFSAYRSFHWMKSPEKGKRDRLTEKHIKYAVKKEMHAKGLKVSSGNPDMLIAVHVVTERKVDVEQWGYSYGTHGYLWGGRHIRDRHFAG